MNEQLKSSLKKIYDAQLTKREKYAIIKELHLKGVGLTEISEITKLSKGRASQVYNEVDVNKPKSFDFYTWLDLGYKNVKNHDVPLSDFQKRQLDILLLNLTKLRRFKTWRPNIRVSFGSVFGVVYLVLLR